MCQFWNKLWRVYFPRVLHSFMHDLEIKYMFESCIHYTTVTYSWHTSNWSRYFNLFTCGGRRVRLVFLPTPLPALLHIHVDTVTLGTEQFYHKLYFTTCWVHMCVVYVFEGKWKGVENMKKWMVLFRQGLDEEQIIFCKIVLWVWVNSIEIKVCTLKALVSNLSAQE